jgi:hypothetical protein
MNKKISLNETLNKIRVNSGLTSDSFVFNEINTDKILSLIYKADYIGLSESEEKFLNEAVDFSALYKGKSRGKDSGFNKKYETEKNYIDKINSVTSNSAALKLIFNTGLVKEPSNPFEAEVVGTRIIVDNNLIKKRAMELSKKMGTLDFLNQHCTVADKFENSLLNFSDGNGKIDHHYIQLPAGVTCPAAGSCLSLYDPELDLMMIGSDNKGGVCYSAAAEERFPNVREKVYKNYYLIKYHLDKGADNLADYLVKSLKVNPSVRILRIHEDGDFFSPEYLRAWILTAQKLKTTHFYFYTKNAKALYHVLKQFNGLPENMVPVISQGYDKSQEPAVQKLRNMGYKMAKIFNTHDDAEKAGLSVDKTDAFAMDPDYKGDFALVYHGSAVAGSDFAKYAYKNKKDPRSDKSDDDKKNYMKTTDRIKYNLSKDI